MGTTLDGKALTVTKWGEGVAVQSSQWDAWVTSAYSRKVKVYGIIRTYIIDSVEQDVTWPNSLANYFETVAANGNTVLLYSDQPVRPVNNVPVYVLDVAYTLENLGGQNIRKFTLTLQEVSYSAGGGGAVSGICCGSATILAGSTSVIVPHLLGSTPSAIVVSPQNDLRGFSFWAPLASRSPTQFTIAVGSSFLADVAFDYVAVL